MMNNEFSHIPVMLEPTLQGLNVKPQGTYIDCTTGGAGHSLEIAKRLDGGKLICIDKDWDALNVAKQRLQGYNVEFVHDDFKNVLKSKLACDGVLMDLGVSSYQLDTPSRGFSYRFESTLDMRMDAQSDGMTAKDVVNEFSESQLAEIFFKYGEEKYSKAIARAIVAERQKQPVETTTKLCEVILKAIPSKARYSGSNPYMRVFQALRICVNNELEGLYQAVIDAVNNLKPTGRICVISFHSLEDRAVKTAMKYLEQDCVCPPSFPVCNCDKVSELQIITKKPITADQSELENNRRAECAKLRIGEKKTVIKKLVIKNKGR